MTSPTINVFPGNTDWPADWQGCRITGKYVDILGSPIQGFLTFKPTPTAVLSGTHKTIVLPTERKVTLDINGYFSVVLPATDDPDLTPVDWTYTVTEKVPGGRTYSIQAPQNAEIDMSQIAPVPQANGTAIVRGPAGASAYELAVQNGFVGTEAAWIDSLDTDRLGIALDGTPYYDTSGVTPGDEADFVIVDGNPAASTGSTPVPLLTVASASATYQSQEAVAVAAADRAPLLLKYGQDLPRPQEIADNLAIFRGLPFDGWVVLTNAMPLTASPVTQAIYASYLTPMPTDIGKARHNWVRMTIPYGDAIGIDWFDDASWAVRLANLTAFAAAIRASGKPIVGVFFDIEWYGTKAPQVAGNGKFESPWNYGDISGDNWVSWTPSATLGATPGRTEQEARTQVRLRGKQVMDALTAGWPTIQVISIFGPWVAEVSSARLLGSFVVGLVESTWTTDAKVIDGGELYSARTAEDFSELKALQKEKWPASGTKYLADPATDRKRDVASYQAAITAAFGVYDVDQEGVDVPHPAGYLGLILEQALGQADRYVWLYTEGHEWAPVAQATKPAVPQSFIDAVAGARTRAQRSRRDGAVRHVKRSPKVEVVTASKIFYKEPGAVSIDVTLVGGAGGGGGGRQGAAATVRCGGGGGTAGATSRLTFDADSIPTGAISIAVGGGGAGGAGAGTPDTNGGNGADAGATAFGEILRANGGTGGKGGTATGGAVAFGAVGMFPSSSGITASASGGVGASGFGAPGVAGQAASGGGVNAADLPNAGGTGALMPGRTGTGGTAGAVDTAGGPGASVAYGQPSPGGAGGGGGASITGPGGNGGAGGKYGAPGGGGGGSLNGFISGTGGAGAPGIALIVTHF